MKKGIINDNEYEYSDKNEKKKFYLDELIYKKAIEKIKTNFAFEIPSDNNLIMIKEKNNYLLKNKKTNEIVYKFIKNPKTIFFWKNDKQYSSFIFHKIKIYQLTKNYNMKNPQFKYNNKSYSLNSNIDSFLDEPNIVDIYEKYVEPEMSEQKFKQFYVKKENLNKKEVPNLSSNKTLKNYNLTNVDLYDYIYNPKEHFNFIDNLKNSSINYIYPKMDNENGIDFQKLRKYISEMEKTEDIYPQNERVYPFHVLFTAGGKGIGKTLAFLYLTDRNIYFNLEKFNNNFQNTIEVFFHESLFAFNSGAYKKYIKFKKNIMKDIHNCENNIFFLIFLFIKYYDTSIFTNSVLYIIIDNYSISKDTNKYLDKLIDEIKKNNYQNNYRIIVNYSLKEKENKKAILSKLIKKAKDFLYLNELGCNYEELDFEDKRIKKVLTKFNYTPYYYFNFTELYKDKNKNTKDIINIIENGIIDEFKIINKIGYILSLIPCIHLIDDINILTEILCEIPLEYFKVKIEDSFGCNKISIKPLNISIEKITDGLIEEKLSNMIVNEFNKILNNQSIQGIAYEIYLTKKIVNSKKFGKNLFKVNYVKNIIF